ncbi:MAG: DUF4975 domain-containing protein [Firmicutes bacterium]|nr:DUF4975 domain-containing protein [Bacillota bacterium]
MMKKLIILPLIIILFGLTGCVGSTQLTTTTTGLPENGSIEQGDAMIFPKSEYGYIGDPMPFYHDGVMNMFYLLDERRGSIGFHPFALFQTSDFLNYDDIGTVIPYDNSISSQDLALGTGSVIYGNDGLYHAYYTGHNGSGEMPYYEKIQHAVSSDMITWTKLPDDGFFGGVNDFRDPYVYYSEEDNEYWMLITTRDSLGGVLKIYKSTDLYFWQNHGTFYRNTEGSYNMECPTLIHYNGYYYLSFSEQGSGNDRIVHYRYTESIEDGFQIPAQDFFDGWGFYAGRIEKVEDRLVLSGWVATKTLDKDYGTYMWGGNLVNHELVQDESGLLYPKMMTETDEFLSNEVAYQIVDTNATPIENGFTFSSNRGYNYLLFEELEEKPTKISFIVDILDSSNFGITLNAYESEVGSLNFYFDFENNRIEFYNVDANLIAYSSPEISIPFDFGNVDELNITMVTEGSVIIVYVNDQIAMTSRAYDMANSNFGFFTLSSNAVISNIHFFE